MKPLACNMPQSLPPEDRKTMESIRKTIVDGYCGQKQTQHYDGVEPKIHKCLGKITMDHESMVFQCPLCGDEKRFI